MRHVSHPPGDARSQLLWGALIVLVLLVWLIAAHSGWLEPLGWE